MNFLRRSLDTRTPGQKNFGTLHALLVDIERTAEKATKSCGVDLQVKDITAEIRRIAGSQLLAREVLEVMEKAERAVRGSKSSVSTLKIA